MIIIISPITVALIILITAIIMILTIILMWQSILVLPVTATKECNWTIAVNDPFNA